MVGVPAEGRLGIASENVPNPVAESSPVKISAPIPAASRPGKRTAVAIAPASPEADGRWQVAVGPVLKQVGELQEVIGNSCDGRTEQRRDEQQPDVRARTHEGGRVGTFRRTRHSGACWPGNQRRPSRPSCELDGPTDVRWPRRIVHDATRTPRLLLLRQAMTWPVW